MVERLAALASGPDEDAQILAQRILADELVEGCGPKGVLDAALETSDIGAERLIPRRHAAPP
jgi:hypothetical protein